MRWQGLLPLMLSEHSHKATVATLFLSASCGIISELPPREAAPTGSIEVTCLGATMAIGTSHLGTQGVGTTGHFYSIDCTSSSMNFFTGYGLVLMTE